MMTSLEFSDEKELAWLIERLPPIVTVHPRSEAQYYGAAWEIARALHDPPKPIHSGASWVHGWRIEPNTFWQQVTSIEIRSFRHLVATQKQADLLTSFGFKDVHAVGSPYIYATPLPTTRVPNSLLVMPTHALAHTIHNFDEDIYAQEIAALKSQFDVIVVCISGNCLKRGMWHKAFEKHGIPWIRGAKVDDQNALCRMATLFQSFEAMTTHVLGSHVPYAGYSGCRVSIFGTYNHLDSSALRYDPNYNKNPQLLHANVQKHELEWVQSQFPQLFTDPKQGYWNPEWYGDLLGEPFRRPPEEVAQLLQWQPSLATYLRSRAEWVSNDLRASTKRMWHRIVGTPTT
ncbi:hypothetical protein Pan97_06430 [Bremerella volcania]|uniref:Uncharacterized protein n=1 Tax=Bremerella volcania TaxID=2527984 RepID=A0A518C344_9BACT|nr:hypothetical protein [Bremerella volcania]QDU73645.1 hypothetical protein Pan97_06430 [Bremerella volcania]